MCFHDVKWRMAVRLWTTPAEASAGMFGIKFTVMIPNGMHPASPGGAAGVLKRAGKGGKRLLRATKGGK